MRLEVEGVVMLQAEPVCDKLGHTMHCEIICQDTAHAFQLLHRLRVPI